MFCYKCGMKLPDEAKFCMGCGTRLDGVAQEQPVNNAQDTKLVLAKCTNCGGQLTVDAGQKSAVCPFCNSKFLIEQAINNYNFNMHGNMNVGSATINVNGFNTDNLIARANTYESENQFAMAQEYYNKVLDIDINNTEANEGIKRIEQKKTEYVYIKTTWPRLFQDDDVVEVRLNRLTLYLGKKIKEEYFFDQMSNIVTSSSAVIFDYPDHWLPVTIECKNSSDAEEIADFINEIKTGIYPITYFKAMYGGKVK